MELLDRVTSIGCNWLYKTKKNSFCFIMVVVAHLDLNHYQMDMKAIFLNGDLERDLYCTT